MACASSDASTAIGDDNPCLGRRTGSTGVVEVSAPEVGRRFCCDGVGCHRSTIVSATSVEAVPTAGATITRLGRCPVFAAIYGAFAVSSGGRSAVDGW